MKLRNAGLKAMFWSVLSLGGMLTWLFILQTLPVQALTIVQKSQVDIKPAETKRILVSIKNQTNETWIGGKTRASLYVYGSSSVVYNSTWVKKDQPASIGQGSVLPGAYATASFYVTAPSKEGGYTEHFLLGDGKNWYKNTTIELNFNVKKTSSVSQPQTITTVPPVVIAPKPTVTPTQLDSKLYSAGVVSTGGMEWQVDPDGHLSVTIKIKNTGSQTWNQDGASPVALYSSAVSNFKDSSWINDRLAVYLNEKQVTSGKVGSFTLQLRAPQSPGKYNESFQLGLAQDQLISGSSFTLPITVNAPDGYITSPPPDASGKTYSAQLLISPRGPFVVSGNATLSFGYGIKNIGTATWNDQVIELKEIVPDLGLRLSSVRHDSWPDYNKAIDETTVTGPGQLSLFNFKIKAPAKKGDYTVHFALVVDGQEVNGGGIAIPVSVTADGYIEPETTTVTPSVPVTTNSTIPAVPADMGNLPNEPIIRVGLFKTTDDTMVIRGVLGGFSLQQNGSTVCSFNVSESVTIVYSRTNRIYKATGPRCTTQSTDYYDAVAVDGLSPLEIADFSRPVSWLPGANDNKFRGKLELRYTPKTDNVWIINELPTEWYLKGIAETSEVSPSEFQKTLLTAARTYAMYHVQHATKHADEYYIVDATYDQVYRGYGQEARSPSIAAAVDATRGIVVTYNGSLAITPYFSRSDGRTRSWSEVWYGTVAWCQSVSVPSDVGKTLWGHGVGMSASGALAMANQGQTWDRILKYFYTGIDLKRWYK